MCEATLDVATLDEDQVAVTVTLTCDIDGLHPDVHHHDPERGDWSATHQAAVKWSDVPPQTLWQDRDLVTPDVSGA
jgi:hypothetical protein